MCERERVVVGVWPVGAVVDGWGRGAGLNSEYALPEITRYKGGSDWCMGPGLFHGGPSNTFIIILLL